jgi:hypothetical protein
MMLVISGAAGKLGRVVAERLLHSAPAPAGDEQAPHAAEEQLIDHVLADSFPASDAPPWTLGVAHDR